ncbi:hypothetical protein GS682_22645 [Nostoc sp. B(2019)]|nr:hypothetical protein [Nostoc sp. B(2019)]
MDKIVIFDFHISHADTFLYDLTPAQAETVLGGVSAAGYPYTAAYILSIHDGINRVQDNTYGVGSSYRNKYSSIDNSDQVFIKYYPI